MAVVLGCLIAACGGGSGPNWEGYADYLNKEVRRTPITVEELKRIHDDPSCEPRVVASSWRLGRSTDIESNVASAYFLCGEDLAKKVVRAEFGGRQETELLRFVEEDLPTYGN